MNSYTFSSFLVVWKLERAVTRPDQSSYCFVIEEKGYYGAIQFGVGVAIRMESTRKESLTPQPQRKYDLTIRARNVTIEIIEAFEDNVNESKC